jgi:iron complex transport system substrate-binding protein
MRIDGNCRLILDFFRFRLFNASFLFFFVFPFSFAQADNFLPFAASSPVVVKIAGANAAKTGSSKIVALTPGIAEWVAEILGAPLTKTELIGVSEYSNYPAYVSQIKTVGAYPQIQVEAVAALHPDLVLASAEYNRAEQVEKLKRLHLHVVVLKAESFTHMEEWIRELGKAMAEESRAEIVARRWQAAMQKLDTQSTIADHRSRRMMIEVQDQPLIAVGGASFLTEAFRKIGYENIFANLEQAYPKVSTEAVLKENPDTIFILDLTHERNEAAIQSWKKFTQLKAAQANAVQVIAGDDFARCSLRLLTALGKLE